MTFQAAKAIQDSQFVIGYKPYLQLISHLLKGKQVVSSAMGKEVARAKEAVDLLSDGSVALVSSGDPNVYGMAGLGLELASKSVRDNVEVVPGVTSFAAAADRTGVVFRDFVAVISLSDLLTPWHNIEERLTLAARYHIPTAIYNPKSKKRDWQLDRALEIFGQDTDVLIAKNIARIGEEFLWTKAGNLLDGEELRDKIDMFTLLILGGIGMFKGDVSGQSRINIVGIGPGSSDKLTLEAERLLRGSAKIFGAERYLHWMEGISSGEPIVHQGSCAKRMASRLQEAQTASDNGHQTSILTGGDPSIFSSAWRILENAGIIRIHVCPGISAFSAVAAKVGAPLVNDFVLLKDAGHPSKINQLVGAGFSIVVYNLGDLDLSILLAGMDPSRPCALARDITRNGEITYVMSASELLEAKPNGTRFTLLVASANSYIKYGRIITKRGYETRYNYETGL
jgi:precorrin-3B C17-methyltransferase